MENDAVIAHAFQEELSWVASAEEAGFHDPAQDLVLNQQWLGPPSGGACHDSDNETGQKVLDDDDSCQKESNHCNGDEKLIHTAEEKPEMEELRRTLDITDESALDGEVGKRLNQMIPVPHVLKTIGQMPLEDEEVSSHQRLLDRLKVYDVVEKGDDNCQFRALLDQLYQSPKYHKHVREQIVNQLKTHREMYEGYVPMSFSEYLKKMDKSGEWGDHVTLQAVADSVLAISNLSIATSDGY